MSQTPGGGRPGSGSVHHSLADDGVIHADGIQGSGAVILTSNGVINTDGIQGSGAALALVME
jgi:hypothetical protein